MFTSFRDAMPGLPKAVPSTLPVDSMEEASSVSYPPVGNFFEGSLFGMTSQNSMAAISRAPPEESNSLFVRPGQIVHLVTADNQYQPGVGSGKHRSYVFTINNPTDDCKEKLQNLLRSKTVKYCVYGREIGESGTYHIQGYVNFNNPLKWTTLKKMLPRAYIAVAKADAWKNRQYCIKDGDYEEVGAIPSEEQPHEKGGEATKRKYQDIVALTKAGEFDTVADEHPAEYLRLYKTLKVIYHDTRPKLPPLERIENYWYWGGTGTGKSHAARAEYPGAFIKNPNKWWDGYAGEDHVIIEDFDKSHAYVGFYLKIWCDKYSFNGEVKGGTVHLNPKICVVTSNYHPKDIWEDSQTLQPLLRRFKVVKFQSLMENIGVDDNNDEVRPHYSLAPNFNLPVNNNVNN